MTSSIEQVNLVGEDLDHETDLHENQIQAIDHTKGKLLELCKELFIDAAQIEGLELAIFSIDTISHELGHAIALKTLFDVHDPIKIHIGTRTPEETPQIFSLGNMYFYKTIPWKSGLTKSMAVSIKKSRTAYENIDSCIGTAAGGLSAAAFMYTLLSAITCYCAYSDNKKLSEIALKSFINGTSPFSYILNTKNLSIKQKRFLINATLVICLSLIFDLFYGCTPYCGGDGVVVWKKHMGVTGIPLKIVHVLSTLGAWGCFALLIKKYCDARKKLSPELSKISIPATLVSLILMRKGLIPSM
ncbi:MAG: hypothetical protein V1646_00160 [bacterium]